MIYRLPPVASQTGFPSVFLGVAVACWFALGTCALPTDVQGNEAEEAKFAKSPSETDPFSFLDDPLLPTLQLVRYDLLSCLKEAGLPYATDVRVVDGNLALRFPLAANRDERYDEPLDFLPLFLVTANAVGDRELGTTGFLIAMPSPRGNILFASVEQKSVRAFLDSEISANQIKSAVTLRKVGWFPDGETAREQAEGRAKYANYLHRDLERPDLAIAELKVALDAQPERVDWRTMLAGAHYTSGNFAAAAKEYALVRELAGAAIDPDSMFLLALSYFASGDFENAAKVAEDGLETEILDPERRATYCWIGTHACLELKAHEKGENFATAYARLQPDVPRAHWYLAMHLEGLNRRVEAIASAALAAKLAQNNPEYLFTLAALQNANGSHGLAAETYQSAKTNYLKMGALPPEKLFVDLSYAYAKLKNSTECAEAAREGLGFYPESPSLQNNYKLAYKAVLLGL